MGELLAPLGRYRREAALAVTGTVGEVVMEVFLPFIMACIIDRGVEAGDMGAVLAYGAAMLAMAALSLGFGMLAGYFSAKASVGYACALREGIFDAVQTYSFSNIDRFSTAGLVTRMITDVTNMQNAAQMLMRIAVRSPIMLVSSLVACVAIAPVFAVAAVFLAAALCLIMLFATRTFDRVFDTYDDLNASVQENVGATRVVKAFVREAYENERFRRAADKLYRLYVRGEGFVALNNPVMMLAVYGCILALPWFGAQLVVGGRLTTGELTSFISLNRNLTQVSQQMSFVTQAAAGAARVFALMDEVPEEDHGYVELVCARELPDGTVEPCEERTEEVVQRGMDALMAGRTTFVIAHRLSTVRDADCICVMEDGRIVERGDHEELMGLHGRYRQLCTGGSAGGPPAAGRAAAGGTQRGGKTGRACPGSDGTYPGNAWACPGKSGIRLVR